jgi:hypothetical protein
VWADVAVVDGPWVESGSAVRSAVEELEARGWTDAVVVCDEWSIWKVIEIADLRPDLFRSFAHGHACTQLSRSGERPSLNPQVVETYNQLLRTDVRMYARAIVQTTRGDYDDATIEAFLSEASHADIIATFERIDARYGQSFAATIHSLNVPLLLARHTECLLWTEEGFLDAVAEFPDAQTVEVSAKPATSPEFVEVLRDFCARCCD